MSNQLRKNTISLTVLSNRPLDFMSLNDVLYEADEGDMVLSSMRVTAILIDKDQMDKELLEAGSDPGFFTDWVEEETENVNS